MNVHDRFFKATFGDVNVAKDFLHNYLPEGLQQAIDFESLLPQKDSFIDKRLKENFSDLLFQANIMDEKGYLYFLFEHKSSPDKRTPLQLLKYIVNIWDAKKGLGEKLPVVIPLVIYQGSQNWRVPKYFIEMMQGFPYLPAELLHFIPNFTYQFYDFSYRSDKEIKGQAMLTIYQILLRELFNPNNRDTIGSITHAMTYFSKIENSTRAMEYFETVMLYIFSVTQNLTKEEGEKMMNKIEEHYPEGKKVAMSLADVYRESGKTEGKVEGIRQITLQLLTNKFGTLPIQLEKEIKKLDLPSLEKIAGNILNYETIEDVEDELKE